MTYPTQGAARTGCGRSPAARAALAAVLAAALAAPPAAAAPQASSPPPPAAAPAADLPVRPSLPAADLSALPPAAAPAADLPVRPSLPAVDLSALPPAVRRHAEELRRTLAAALADPAATPRQLAGGFALLGQLDLAYGLAAAAEAAFDAALTLLPDDPDLLHRRGMARRDAGDHAGAAADFRAVAAARPEATAVWLHLGEALLAAGRHDEAAAAFAAARDLGARAAAGYGLGRAALAAGDAAAAVEHLQAAISLQPSATVGHAALARAYEARGDEERARRHRARTGEGGFAFPDPLAEELRRLRTFTAFEALREMAADSAPGFDEEAFVAFVLAELGGVAAATDRLRAAVAEADAAAAAPAGGEEPPAAARNAAERARLRLALGALLLGQGRRDEAIGALSAAVALAPELDHARLQLAGALAQEGRYGEAIAHFDALLAADPDDAVALTRRAASRVRLGRRAEARRDLERALAVAADAGTRAEAHTFAAGLALDDGAAELAERHYRQALDADPGHADALRGLGLLQGRLARYREAAATLARLVAVAPADGDARDAEAVALILAGDEAAARERLEAAVEALPDDPRLAGRLARLLAAASDRALRDGERAVELALAVFAVEPTAETVETLAMAYAEAGDFAQAVTWQERLLAAEDAAGSAADRERRRRHLALYRSGASCCGEAPPTDRGGSR